MNFAVKSACSASIVAMMGLAPQALADAPTSSMIMDPAPLAEEPAGRDWSGFYAGGNVGMLWISGSMSTGTDEGQGIFTGLHVGYNFQNGDWVYGIEADYARGSVILCEYSDCSDDTNHWSQTNTLASVRARAGMAFDDILVYATGGMGYIAGIDVSSTEQDDTGPIALSGVGVIGAGIEKAVGNNSIRLEVLTLLANDKDMDPVDDSCCVQSVRFMSNPLTVRVGFTAHF